MKELVRIGYINSLDNTFVSCYTEIRVIKNNSVVFRNKKYKLVDTESGRNWNFFIEA